MKRKCTFRPAFGHPFVYLLAHMGLCDIGPVVACSVSHSKAAIEWYGAELLKRGPSYLKRTTLAGNIRTA